MYLRLLWVTTNIVTTNRFMLKSPHSKLLTYQAVRNTSCAFGLVQDTKLSLIEISIFPTTQLSEFASTMSDGLASTEWPPTPISTETKQLLARFVEIVDLKDEKSGQLLADEIFVSDGKLVASVGSFNGIDGKRDAFLCIRKVLGIATVGSSSPTDRDRSEPRKCLESG